MDCHEAQDLIHAYFDGELDLVRTLDIEHHIRDCRNCSKAHQALAALRTSTRNAGLYFKAPLGLSDRIRSGLRQARGEPAERRMSIGWRWVAVAASVALVTIGIWAILGGAGGSGEMLLAAEVRSSHVRSLMGTHLFDVESSDQHTVKPWFDGKLDFAPDVLDLKADSFPLVGGRLDYLANRSVAALVYRHEKHFINLFIWPSSSEKERGEAELSETGYSVIHWTHGGMNHWAICDTSDQTLRHFADLYRNARAATTKP